MNATTLAAGARLGPYEIAAFVGAGGMGEVYRARDTRLDRTVAIKILPARVSNDPGRRQRFAHEARLISGLSHPHLRALYDVGRDSGIDFLVMEYVDGEPLDRVLARKPLPLVKVLTYAREVADALDAAHRHGVVHGDIKPANIMITAAGAKLLDFGIGTLTASPITDDSKTLTDNVLIAGTTPYMAPEQIEGRIDDPRSDLFSLGIVLYEMLSGNRPFEGATRARVMAAILEHEPPPLTGRHETIPPGVERVVMKCLAKDPDARWQTARDLSSELAWLVGPGAQPAPRSAAPRLWLPWAVTATIIAAGLIASGLLTRAWSGSTSNAAAAPPIRFVAEPPVGSAMSVSPGGFSVSPDGRHLAFVASAGTGTRQLWLRTLDSFEVHALSGTDDAWNPFWSPDSKSLAFTAGGQLRRNDLAANHVETICDMATSVFGTWNRTGTILVSANAGVSMIMKVPASGGTPVPLKVPAALRDASFGSPEFLPDGEHFLYHARTNSPSTNGVYLASLGGGDDVLLVHSDSQAQYAAPGYLAYLRGGTLVAQPFDATTLKLTGEAKVLPEPVSFVGGIDRGAFSISQGAVLAYRGRVETSDLLWFDRAGRPIGALASGAYINPALSPDGARVAVTKGDPPAGTSDIWIIDTNRGPRQLTDRAGVENFPVWSPDGKFVLFAAERNGMMDIYQKDAAAAAGDPDQPVARSQRNKMPFDWSRDGRFILYATFEGRGMMGARFWLGPTAGLDVPTAIGNSSSGKEEGQAQISPDGRWLAYVSDVNGSPQVFVRPFPHGPGRWLVSSRGGLEPKWRADGGELFYLGSDQMMMSVDIQPGAAFAASEARPLFRTNIVGAYLGSPFPNGRVRNEYAVTRDGQRFLIDQPLGGTSAYGVRLVINWAALLAQ
jgi:Tol biopolymer transport system component/predicted Ser/Thr protein kinase